MTEFRRLEGDEVVTQAVAVDHAFGSDPGPPSYDGPDDVEDRVADRWGLFEDGDLVSACALYDLRVTLAGDRRPLGGFAAFTTPPEHRAGGHGETLQREALRVFREQGYPYAALWPASIPYYRRAGWALVHAETEYRFPAATLPTAETDDGTFDRVTPAEYERLLPAYEAWAERYDLAIDRSATWWRDRVLEDRWIYAWTPDDADAATGYVVFRLSADEDSHDDVMVIDELVYRDEGARRRLLELVRRHAPQVTEVRWSAPEETRLLHDAVDPKEVTATVEPGAMGRIVDIADAVERLPPARNPAESLTLRVRDSLLDANDGTVRIEAGADGPTVAPASADPDVEVDVGLLSKLYAGTLDASTAVERGALSASDAAVAALDDLFPERPVYLNDFY